MLADMGSWPCFDNSIVQPLFKAWDLGGVGRRGSVYDAVPQLAAAVALRPPSTSSQAAPLDSRQHAAATGRRRREGGRRERAPLDRPKQDEGRWREVGLGSLAWCAAAAACGWEGKQIGRAHV